MAGPGAFMLCATGLLVLLVWLQGTAVGQRPHARCASTGCCQIHSDLGGPCDLEAGS